mmetsp:Transcript_57188/g.77994  ORF Transcript_57188/g.77994 Transcript_57188/m.77994 type:complete len:220 (+) Transcript_57188:1891-2550(+)
MPVHRLVKPLAFFVFSFRLITALLFLACPLPALHNTFQNKPVIGAVLAKFANLLGWRQHFRVGVNEGCEIVEKHMRGFEKIELGIAIFSLRQPCKELAPAHSRVLGRELDDVHVHARQTRRVDERELVSRRSNRYFVRECGSDRIQLAFLHDPRSGCWLTGWGRSCTLFLLFLRFLLGIRGRRLNWLRFRRRTSNFEFSDLKLIVCVVWIMSSHKVEFR